MLLFVLLAKVLAKKLFEIKGRLVLMFFLQFLTPHSQVYVIKYLKQLETILSFHFKRLLIYLFHYQIQLFMQI